MLRKLCLLLVREHIQKSHVNQKFQSKHPGWHVRPIRPRASITGPELVPQRDQPVVTYPSHSDPDPVVPLERFERPASLRVLPPVHLAPVSSSGPAQDPALLIGLHPGQVVFFVAPASVERQVEMSVWWKKNVYFYTQKRY